MNDLYDSYNCHKIKSDSLFNLRQINHFHSTSLPPATFPFDPRPTPRKNLNPVGARPIGERSEEERYLHSLLQLVADANPKMLTGILSPENFRFEYDKDQNKSATVGLSNLVVRVSDKFFNRITCDAEAAAILCHEVSHIIRGHEEFHHSPPCVLSDRRYKATTSKLNSATKRLSPESIKNIFSRYDMFSRELKTEYCKSHPGMLETLEEKRRRARGDESKQVKNTIELILEDFANSTRTPLAKNFLEALKDERNYERNLSKWQIARREQQQVIDKILGEENASFNWHEQEADQLGLRLFIRTGFEANDFLKTFANTLDKGSGELNRYLDELKQVKNPINYKLPPRGNENHPSPKWRIANLAIRELRLRYPREYESLSRSAPKFSPDKRNPLGTRLNSIRSAHLSTNLHNSGLRFKDL